MAARVADAWERMGPRRGRVRARSARLRELAGGRLVAPTWGGIALVGEDRASLDRLLDERATRGLSLEGVWAGTTDDLRRFAAALRAIGTAWFVVLPVGPDDRLDVIVDALTA